MLQSISAAILAPALLLLVGCASSWEKSFERNPMISEKAPPVQEVELRTVEFERLQTYEQAEKQLRVNSSTAPADYTPEQRLEAKNRLLEALQLKDRGDAVDILGWSRFADNEQIDLRDKKLLAFAQKIGADVVVASSAFAGQVNRTRDYPLTSYSNYYTTVTGPRGRRGTFYSGSGYSTVWVPTTVTENQYIYQAVFLRRRH
jgi:hypothetical protein